VQLDSRCFGRWARHRAGRPPPRCPGASWRMIAGCK